MDLATLLLACIATDPAPAVDPSTLADSPIGMAAMRSFDAAAFAIPLTIKPVEEEGRRDDFKFDYSYVELGYTQTDVDAANENLDAWHLRGSFEFMKFLYGFAGYSVGSSDFDNADVDAFDLGIGGHFAVMKRLDLLGEVAWLWNNIDGDLGGSDSDTGFSVFVGARFLVLPFNRGGLEVNGGLRRTEIDGFSSDRITNSFELGARVHFMNRFSVGLTYADMEDDSRIGIDGRFSF
jgi:hypothetical protein